MNDRLRTADPAAVAFDDFEIRGWRKLGRAYHDNLGPLTSRVAKATVDTAAPRPGDVLLDVGAGPGYVAAEAAARDIATVACDVSEPMVELARALHPELSFELADARDLPFGDGAFDILTAGFVLLHTALPELVVGEAVRVLRPGGRFVATVYDEPGRARYAGLFGEALADVELTPPAVPAGPGLFDLSAPERLESLLGSAGLAGVRVSRLELTHRVPTAEDLYDAFAHGTVRAAAVLAAQRPGLRDRIVAALAAHMAPYRQGDHYEIPVSFLVASGHRPTG